MSNLLKKNLEPDIAAFGFPVIENGHGDTKLPLVDENESIPEPEKNSEQLYRIKLLELDAETRRLKKKLTAKDFRRAKRTVLNTGKKPFR